MINAIKLNMGKIVKVAVSVAVAASIVVPNFVKADNYGFNGNWNIYKTQNVMFAKILNSTVPDNPSAPNNLNKHNVQAQMDKYNSNISKYTVVNSITNGATVGEDPVETGDVKFKYSLETLNDSNNTVAGWYSSTYGPLLDYGTPNYTNLDKQAEDFLRFDKLLFPQGNDRVYVTQGRINYMRDAKTIATLYNAKYPIVLDQGSTSVAESANELNAKKLIFLGGTGNAGCNAIFSSMEGVGDNGYDMVRIGGINSEQTARFLKQLPESVYDSPDQPEDGVTVDSSVSSSLVNGLTDTLKKQGFTAAVKQALSKNIGADTEFSEKNVKSGTPALTITGINGTPTGDAKKDAANKECVKIYLCNPTSGQLVFQYFQKGFFTNQNKDGTYNLTVKVSPEGAGTAGDNAKLKAGATKTLWEKPNEGYYFTGWTTNPKDVKIDSKNTLTMPAANVTATANFSNSVGFVNLTVKSSPEGAGTVTGGGNKRLIDGKAIFSGITETPNKNAPEESHWQFDHWGVTQGDNVAPDSKSNITIIKDTTLVAYFKLINDSQPVNVGGDENSTLTINSTVAAAWHNADDLTISDAGAAIAKEGQLVTFDVKTASNDFRYTERLNDLYFGHSYPPDKYFDYNSGFQGNLEHVSRQYHSYSTKHHYYWWWTADYWGHIYREPVKWYSAFQLNFTFPDELTNPPVGDLNPALQKNLNTNLNPDGTMLWYIQSNPFIVLNNSVEYDNAFNTNYEHENHAYEQWKQNEEKIEFYVPLTTPITVEDDGTRIREPYKIKIQGVETNGKITATTYVNLDVKGNIYKGIYTTPVG